MADVDPDRLARRQIDSDVRRTAWLPTLLARKRARMSVSPLAFLRGSAPLYFALLKQRKVQGPGGVGWIAGDLHVENFGAYRPNPAPEHHGHSVDIPDAVFNLNDFDDAVEGPWWLDTLRLTTSLILGARAAGADGNRAVDLAWSLLAAYARAAASGTAPSAPAIVARLVETAAHRSRRQLLDDRTEVVAGRRRFVRGDRYLNLPAAVRRAVPSALARYRHSLAPGDRPGAEHFEILDAAFRVAGTGSLGCLRIAVLTVGKGGRDGAWIMDVKEEGSPSAQAFIRVRAMPPAVRVLAGLQHCLEHPPRFAGVTRLGRRSMLVRKLTPQEDKLDFTKLDPGDWNQVSTYLGALAGAAHRRGMTRPPSAPWGDNARTALLDHAIWLAGVHESTYLAYCHQWSR